MGTVEEYRDRILAARSQLLEQNLELDLADVARESIERITAQVHGTSRVLDSAGSLRFTGDGVNGHSMSAAAFGNVLSGFQMVVTSIGGHLREAKPKGRLPREIVDATRLLVLGGPAEGSVIARIKPERSGVGEVEPEGEPLVRDDSVRPLADIAVDRALSLLQLPADADLDAWTGELRKAGARAASALRELALSLAGSNLTLQAQWEEPGRLTRRSKLTSGDARRMAVAIKNHKLDAVLSTLVGEVATVSSRRAMEIMVGDDIVRVAHAQLPADAIRKLHVGAMTRVEVLETLIGSPTGEQSSKYEALSVELIDQDPLTK